VSVIQPLTGRTVRRLTLVLIVLGLCAMPGGSVPSAESLAPQKSSKPAPKASVQQTRKIPASLLQALRSSVTQAVPVKSVRSPRSGVVRIALDQPIVKETEYRTALTTSCGEIMRAKVERIVASIEIVNADQRQGYVYRPGSSCEDVLAAAEERRRLAILPGTTIFQAR